MKVILSLKGINIQLHDYNELVSYISHINNASVSEVNNNLNQFYLISYNYGIEPSFAWRQRDRLVCLIEQITKLVSYLFWVRQQSQILT